MTSRVPDAQQQAILMSRLKAVEDSRTELLRLAEEETRVQEDFRRRRDAELMTLSKAVDLLRQAICPDPER